VEVCARAVVTDGRFRFVRLAAGGIAPRPLRLLASEALLLGAEANEETMLEAARRATTDANPLPMTEYKLDLLIGVVNDLLERLAK
jgi:xanthine dehydrogenase YagS FAD-binding subunit